MDVLTGQEEILDGPHHPDIVASGCIDSLFREFRIGTVYLRAVLNRSKQANHFYRAILVSMDELRFICDAMLGRLANWLRILGYDTVFIADIADNELIAIAETQKRVLLTRDTHLLKRKLFRSLSHGFISSNDFREQVRQVIAEWQLTKAHIGTRCLRCNEVLQQTSKASVQNVLPFFVAATQTQFKRCPRCRRVYWPATHHESFQREIDAMFTDCDF